MFSANLVKIQQSKTLDSEKWHQKKGPKQQQKRLTICSTLMPRLLTFREEQGIQVTKKIEEYLEIV